MDSFKRPLFSVGIHLNSYTGTRSQRGQEQFVRVRPRVFATVLVRFVPLEHMRADGYVLDKSQRFAIYVYISRHIPPLYLPVSVSQGDRCMSGSNKRLDFRCLVFRLRIETASHGHVLIGMVSPTN